MTAKEDGHKKKQARDEKAFDWDNMDGFFAATDEVGEILDKRAEEDEE